MENLIDCKIIALPTNNNEYGVLCLTENGLDESRYVKGDKKYYDVHIINDEAKYINDDDNRLLIENNGNYRFDRKSTIYANDKIIGVLLTSTNGRFIGTKVNNTIIEFFLKGGVNIKLDCKMYSDGNNFLAIRDEYYETDEGSFYDYTFHINESKLDIPFKINKFKEETVSIFYDKKRIGTVDSHLQLNDICIQVKENKIEGVTVVNGEGRVFNIDQYGKIAGGICLFPTYSDQLKKIMGF